MPPALQRSHALVHWSALASLAAICTGVLLEPIYVQPSGLPQPADAFFVLGVILGVPAALANPPISNRAFFLFLFLFTFWVYTVTATWASILSYFDIRKFYYVIYNATICYVVATLCRIRPKHALLIAQVVCVSLVLEAVLVLLLGDLSGRDTGSSTNPNQLAYWSINALMIGLFVFDRFSVGPLVVLVTIASALAILSVTISKAAGVGIALFFILYILITRPYSAVLRMMLLGSVVTLQIVVVLSGNITEWWIHRTLTRGGDLSLTEFLRDRAYDRIWEFPQYLVFGASELQIHRFGSLEIHSTLANVLFSYGFLGLFLFLAIITLSIRGDIVKKGVFLVAPMIFGLAHNGIRSTLLWILLAMLVSLEPASKPTDRRFGQKPVTPSSRRRLDPHSPDDALI